MYTDFCDCYCGTVPEARKLDNLTTANGYVEDVLVFFSVKHVKLLNTQLENVLKMDHFGLIFSAP